MHNKRALYNWISAKLDFKAGKHLRVYLSVQKNKHEGSKWLNRDMLSARVIIYYC